jgi:hypothetical protein
MSFFNSIFPARQHSAVTTRPAPRTGDDHRRHVASETMQTAEQRANLDLASRVQELEQDAAHAAMLVEALVELLEERVGIPRHEISSRIAEMLALSTAAANPLRPDTSPPAPPPTPELPPQPPRERFLPRRNWRDAK